jgi:hypothetical protein
MTIFYALVDLMLLPPDTIMFHYDDDSLGVPYPEEKRNEATMITRRTVNGAARYEDSTVIPQEMLTLCTSYCRAIADQPDRTDFFSANSRCKFITT